MSWQWEDNPAKNTLQEAVAALRDLENQAYELLKPISTQLDKAWQADNPVRGEFRETLDSQVAIIWAVYDDALATCDASQAAEPDRIRYWVDDPIFPDDQSWPPSSNTCRKPR